MGSELAFLNNTTTWYVEGNTQEWQLAGSLYFVSRISTKLKMIFHTEFQNNEFCGIKSRSCMSADHMTKLSHTNSGGQSIFLFSTIGPWAKRDDSVFVSHFITVWTLSLDDAVAHCKKNVFFQWCRTWVCSTRARNSHVRRRSPSTFSAPRKKFTANTLFLSYNSLDDP